MASRWTATCQEPIRYNYAPDGITSLEASMESHFICMAAEESRIRGGACVEMKTIRKG